MKAVISVQVVTEVSGVLYRNFGIKDTVKYVDVILSYRTEVVPVTSEIARSAAELAREFKILPYDGIHIATAKEANCDTFLSADKEFDKQNLVKRVDPLDRRAHIV